jgi:hypothetical protein
MQWRNRIERLPGTGFLPIRLEFCTVQLGSLPDEPERSRWKLADQRLERCDHDLRLMLAVNSVEVRRLVVAVVHRDHDPVEGADARHGFIVAEVARFDHCLFWSHVQPAISSDFAMQCPRQESNLCTRFRKPLLYPLSYGGEAAPV